jgi:hypothetical protein
LLVSSSSSSSYSYLGVWAFEALLHSVHVKVTLQDSLLESIRLGPLRLPGLLLDGRSLSRRLRHLGNGLCPIVDRASWRRGGGEREGSARSTYDGTLGTRPKLLGPVETLLVISRATIRTYVTHVGRTEAHPSDKRRSRCSLGVHIVIFDSALINGVRIVRVGRHASSTNKRRCVCG